MYRYDTQTGRIEILTPERFAELLGADFSETILGKDFLGGGVVEFPHSHSMYAVRIGLLAPYIKPLFGELGLKQFTPEQLRELPLKELNALYTLVAEIELLSGGTTYLAAYLAQIQTEETERSPYYGIGYAKEEILNMCKLCNDCTPQEKELSRRLRILYDVLNKVEAGYTFLPL